MCVHMLMEVSRSWFSLSSVWGPGTVLRSSGLMASTFIFCTISLAIETFILIERIDKKKKVSGQGNFRGSYSMERKPCC